MKKILSIVATIFVAINTLFCFGIMWVMRTWPNNTVAEIKYHMFNTSLKGTSFNLVLKGMLSIVIPVLLVIAALFAVKHMLKKKEYIVFPVLSY